MSKSPQRSSTTEINKHTGSGYSLFMHCSFDVTERCLIAIEVKTV